MIGRLAGRVALAGAGALAARAALRRVRAHPRHDELERTNFHGRTVSLAGGPALAASATATAALGAGSIPLAAAALVAGGGAGAVGLYDDIAGARPEQKSAKGFKGHLAALREGRVTSGAVKVAGVGAAALVAATLVDADRATRDAVRAARAARAATGAAAGRRRKARAWRPRGPVRRLVDIGLGAGVIAGTANLVNLLDLRPGRALKAGTVLAAPLLAGPAGGLVAGPAGAGAALLPDDLGEEIMLGDSGANAFGALLGLALAARTSTLGRAAALAVLASLTAASEKVSFTTVIESTPGLRELDTLGRRTDHDVDGPGTDRSRFLG
jgi:UDP-N-acetylmuramyl pentapeptide phosphotransferase/UDP-N-acetylglucosamine-1-phosphate transferase